MPLIAARDAIGASGTVVTQAMIELDYWTEPPPKCEKEDCDGTYKVVADGNRLRYACCNRHVCRAERFSVLRGSSWYFPDGRGVPPRKIAVLLLANREGKDSKHMAALAGVDIKTVARVLSPIEKPTEGTTDRVETSVTAASAKSMCKKRRMEQEEETSDEGEYDDHLSDYEPVETPAGHIHFEGIQYRVDAELLPNEYHQTCQNWMHANAVTDRPLFYSLMFFLLLVLAYQPTAAFIDPASRGKIAQSIADAPAVNHYVVKAALGSGDLPMFDASLRTRSIQALGLFTALYDEACVTEPTLTAWVLLDMLFRYPGKTCFITDTILAPSFRSQTRGVFASGLTTTTGPAILTYVHKTLIFFVEMRTDVSTFFALGDGRPQLVRGRCVPTLAPDYRPMDHILDAMKEWLAPCLRTGTALWKLLEVIESLQTEDATTSRFDELADATRGLMEALLGFELMGRPTTTDKDFLDRMLVYVTKFPLSDMFIFLASILCRSAARSQARCIAQNVGVRCRCIACSALWKLRLRFTFFGPSPRAFLCALRRLPAGSRTGEADVVHVWRFLTLFLNEAFAALLCLYFVQMLPCSWRRFLRLRRRCVRMSMASLSWLRPSNARILRERVYALETEQINNALDWLVDCDLLAAFEALPLERRQSILNSFSWGRGVPRDALAARIYAIEPPHSSRGYNILGA